MHDFLSVTENEKPYKPVYNCEKDGKLLFELSCYFYLVD